MYNSGDDNSQRIIARAKISQDESCPSLLINITTTFM